MGTEPDAKLRDFFPKTKQIGLLEKVLETGAKQQAGINTKRYSLGKSMRSKAINSEEAQLCFMALK